MFSPFWQAPPHHGLQTAFRMKRQNESGSSNLTPHILVIDDAAAQRRSLKAAIEALGHAVHVADSDQAGLEVFRRYRDEIGAASSIFPRPRGPATGSARARRPACQRSGDRPDVGGGDASCRRGHAAGADFRRSSSPARSSASLLRSTAPARSAAARRQAGSPRPHGHSSVSATSSRPARRWGAR
jgi:hypothetical protein